MKLSVVPLLTFLLLIIFAPLRSAGENNFNPDDFLKGVKIVSPSGTYKGGKSSASNDFLASLVNFGKFLKENSRLMIRINGYTDNNGMKKTNEKISFLRAQKIKNFLVKKLNIYKDRIFVRGFAAEFPIADNSSEKGRMKNRRVEIQLLKNPPSAGIITSILRKVFTRAPQEITFRRAELLEPLFNRYRLNTGDRSDVNITLRDKSKLNIGPNSLMVIYEQNRKDFPDLRKREVRLLTGFLRTKLSEIRSGFRVKTPACDINSGSRVILVDISKDKKSAVSVFDGKSEVIAHKKSVDVPSGYGTFVKKGEKPAEPEPLPKAPKNIYPENNVFFISGKSNEKKTDIVFRWKSTEDINHIQVAYDKTFEKILMSRKVKGETLTFSFKSGEYFWRVAGISVNGIEGYTSESSFVVKPEKKYISLDIFPKVVNSLREAHDSAMISKNRFVTVKGKTIPGSSIQFDGMIVKVDKNGNFLHRIDFNPGWNLISVIVKHSGFKTKQCWMSICYYPGLNHSRFYKIKSIKKSK